MAGFGRFDVCRALWLLLFVIVVPTSLRAAWTSTVFGTSAFMSGTSSGDSITISVSGSYLAHDRYGAGDPGFASGLDFDNSAAGDQLLLNDGTSSLAVNALGGIDSFTFVDAFYVNGSNVMVIDQNHIYPGYAGGNRPTISYLNFENVSVLPQLLNSGVKITGVDPSVHLSLSGPADEDYEISTSSDGNLDTILGTISIYGGGLLDMFDHLNANNNTAEIQPDGVITRNGHVLLDHFAGSHLTYNTGPGHNQFLIHGNNVPDCEIIGKGQPDEYLVSPDSANFAQPVAINYAGFGSASLTVNDFAGGQGHSYTMDGNGALSRDGQTILNSVTNVYNISLSLGPANDIVTVTNPHGFSQISLNSGSGGTGDILEFLPFPESYSSLQMKVLGGSSLVTGRSMSTFNHSGFDYLFVNQGIQPDTMLVTPSPTCSIFLDGGDPSAGVADALTVAPEGRPYTLNSDTFQAQGCQPVSFSNYESVMTQFLDDNTSLPAGWSQFGATTAKASTGVDPAVSALLATITSDPSASYRIIGWLSDATNTMHYSSVGSGNFLRAKFYVYHSGQTGAGFNRIPNFRLRLANRFAVTSMLTVANHESSDPEASTLAQDIAPTDNQVMPSVYRVDFDPIDVPQLVTNAATEGFLRAFEVFEHDPQANGSIGMSECSVAVYPRLTDTSTTVPVTQNGLIKSYRTTATGGGDFGTGNIASSNSSAVTAKYFNGALETTGGQPLISVGSSGVTMQTLNVESNRLGVAAFDVFNDTYDQTHHTSRARIEPNKQYRIRFHATSTAASNLQPLLRFRARTIKFMYTASLELGGATGASVQSNAIAAQALPGIGNQIPAFDRINPSENGGWYNVMMVTPMNSDIQSFQNNLNAQDDPGEDTQPASNSKSRRDLQFGFDIIDTASAQPTSGMERGQMTVDRVDIEKYDLLLN